MTIDIPAQESPVEEYQQFIAALRRSNAETEKFIQESHKLAAERDKLIAEERKFRLEPWIAAMAAAFTALGVVLNHYFGK
jgi:hypothetical protein